MLSLLDAYTAGDRASYHTSKCHNHMCLTIPSITSESMVLNCMLWGTGTYLCIVTLVTIYRANKKTVKVWYWGIFFILS